MANNIKIVAGYFIDKRIKNDEEIKQYLDNLTTYLPNIDKLYIYNQTKSDVSNFINQIPTGHKIEYAEASDYGEA